MILLKNHVRVISGDSGSGKTETFKYAVKYFTKATSKNEILTKNINEVSTKYNLVIKIIFKI